MIRKILKEIIYRIRGEYTIEHLKKMGLTVGKNFNPQLGFELDPSHCWLITIGDNVTFGPHVQVLAHDASTCAFCGYAKIGRVSIGDNCFIGAGSIVLPNVTIGNNVIVGAGAVVTKSIPDNVVVVGNPAKIIMTIEDFIIHHKKMIEKSPVYDDFYTLRKNVSEELKSKQRHDLINKIGYQK